MKKVSRLLSDFGSRSLDSFKKTHMHGKNKKQDLTDIQREIDRDIIRIKLRKAKKRKEVSIEPLLKKRRKEAGIHKLLKKDRLSSK